MVSYNTVSAIHMVDVKQLKMVKKHFISNFFFFGGGGGGALKRLRTGIQLYRWSDNLVLGIFLGIGCIVLYFKSN